MTVRTVIIPLHDGIFLTLDDPKKRFPKGIVQKLRDLFAGKSFEEIDRETKLSGFADRILVGQVIEEKQKWEAGIEDIRNAASC